MLKEAMSLFTGLFILGGVFFTSILSGIVGMAGGMVLMGLLVWVLPVQQAMVLHGTAQFFANGSRAFIHRKHLRFDSINYYMLGMAASFTLFCLVTFVPDKIVVFSLLGIVPFIPALLGGRVKFDFTKPAHAVACGALVTCFHLTAGVSGPMLDMFFQKIPMTRHEVVSTKAFTQSISHVSKLVYFGFIVPAALDGGAWLPLWIYAAVIPTAVLGTNLAKHVLNRLTDVQFYKATQLLLWAIGAVYLVKAAAMVLQPAP
jgi:uncharacterized membrane protein YfcA